jgi:hypothetical protein
MNVYVNGTRIENVKSVTFDFEANTVEVYHREDPSPSLHPIISMGSMMLYLGPAMVADTETNLGLRPEAETPFIQDTDFHLDNLNPATWLD